MKSKNIVGWVVPAILCASFCSATDSGSIVRNRPLGDSLSLPTAFPLNAYTPHGYIDNPYHSMVFNRSGVIRSFPPLGFGWWCTDFRGSYAEGVRDHVNYCSILQMSLAIDGEVFATPEDFTRVGAELTSRYHTKHLLSYDWEARGVRASLRFFLPREHTLACLVELENNDTVPKRILLHPTQIYLIGGTKWWGSNGLTAHYTSNDGLSVSKVWAYGDVFVLGSDLKCIAHKATDSEQQWLEWVRRGDVTSTDLFSARGRGPLRMIQTYELTLQPKEETHFLLCLSRGKNELQAKAEFAVGLKEAIPLLKTQLAEDQAFWSSCPVLEGDWPEAWKRGWVYDFETLRMNVRPPLGIFKHPWDAMQVHSPRVVLGETSLDMMTLSYADPKLAKKVIYGTFADALMPNVPCAREDGSVNMISSDGSECGTAPMWGFPFHVIQSIYGLTGDKDWVGSLYPYLKSYIEWWLTHRTDKEGWLHCNNDWESGQDGSRRFLVAERNEGAVASFVRTVDVEASMAEAMTIMASFADIIGKSEEKAYWNELADRRTKNTQSMFVDGSFRDFDGRSNSPIILKDFFDVMMLAPVTCGAATPDQVEALRPVLRTVGMNSGHSLEWPPRLFAFVEAAWNAGMPDAGAEATATTADRVYERTDARHIFFDDREDPFSYRIPGIANEFWPVAQVPAGGQNYGWGATLPMNILRTIVGFREMESLSPLEFFLAPSLPKTLAVAGKTFKVRHLHYRGLDVDVTYEVLDPQRMRVHLEYRSGKPVLASVLKRSGDRILQTTVPQERGKVSFVTENGSVLVARFE
jgi:hypothetical protein